jgi:TetR/AcrR family transcriptional repressor of nem operon
MRYPADQREKTRQRILDAAGIVFRRHGFQAASVDLVMTEAGLTAGAFYAHFKSKDDLFSETLIQALKQGRVVYGKEDDSLQGAARIRAIVARYLSPGHRQIVDRGCAMPPLLSELPRQSPETRQAFQDVFSDIVASLEPHLSQDQPSEKSDQALALLALMIGGLSLSRAVADADLADRILAACRTLVDTVLQHSPVSQSEQS